MRKRNRLRANKLHKRKLTIKSGKKPVFKAVKRKPFFPKKVVKASTFSSKNHSEFYFLQNSNLPVYTAAITIGRKVINSNKLMEFALSELKNEISARKKVVEVTGYTLNDLIAIGDLPKVGSQATGKISITKGKKGQKNHILLSGIIFPSLKISPGKRRRDIKRTFYRRLVGMLEAKPEFKGKSVLEVRVNSSNTRIRNFLEQQLNFKLDNNATKTINGNILVLKRLV